MDGFKNSTRVQYMKGGSCEGYAKGGKVKGAAKIAKVMGEFKAGTLHSGSKKGPEVTNPKQAVAIAMSEARKAGMKAPVKKAGGGSMMKENITSRPVKVGMTPEEKAAAAALARAERIQREEAAESAIMRDRNARPVIKPRPLGRGAARDIVAGKGVPVASREPMIKRAQGGLAAMPHKK